MSDFPAPKSTNGAVFLSYAREDADAARRIADALRAFGVEAWFDQAELRGGDAWDAKIKKQIRECALFMPVISGGTQKRHEGYFRREWKLAVERTHDMAAGVAFIVPVVVDDTPEGDAAVPEEFMRVQWTRLPHGVPSTQFVEQVKRLLETPRKAGRLEPGRPRSAERGPFDELRAGEGAASPKKPSKSGWTIAAVVAVAIGVGVTYFATRPVPSSAPAVVAQPPVVSPAAAKISAKSIAVLPLANLSPDPANEFFADGMHDEVITALAKIRDLTVISRTSVMAYKKTEGRNLKKIAAELGVATVLEGSVQRAGNRVKVIVQLIDARTDQHLWAETYVEDLNDVFTIQSKLAGAITSALKATLSPEEKSRIARRPTENQEAYDLYLRARALSESIGSTVAREDIERSIALYEHAVARDPAFVLAQVQLCYLNGTMYWFGTLDPTPARRARSKAALDAAFRLAPDLAETRLARGAYFYLCENDWGRALEEYRAAEAGLPNDSQLQYLIAIAQRRLGRLPEALASFARSTELNPRDSTAPPQQVQTLRAMRRYAETRDLAARYVALFPTNENLLLHLSVARLELDHDRAAFLRQAQTRAPGPDDAHGLVKAYRIAMLQGDLAGAARTLADSRLESVPATGGVISDPVALHRASVAFLRGQKEESARAAEDAISAYRARSWAPRQEPWVMLGTALAHAIAGRPDDALRLGREGAALAAARDAFTAIDARHAQARIFLVLDRRDDALACLREMMTTAGSATPELVRLDPLWARIKDDPRFEEILKQVKPL